MKNELLEKQELLRANAIVAKARRDGDNVAKALKDHMVSGAMIERVLGEAYTYTPKKRRNKSEDTILEWARNHVGDNTSLAIIAEETGLSYPTVNKIVSLRTDWFAKIKRGLYAVRDADAERKSQKAKD